MPHYNLYASLGLDRNASTTTLAAEINQRISELGVTGGARYSELRTARAVLGDEERRSLYDRQLDNPSAPEITSAAVEELAAMPVAGTGTSSSGYTQEIPVAPASAAAAPAAAISTAPARRPWVIPATLATVVVAVAAVVIVWMVTSNGSDDTVAASDSTFGQTAAPDTAASTTEAVPSTTATATRLSTPEPDPEPTETPVTSLVPRGTDGYGLDLRESCGTSSGIAGRYFAGNGGAGTASCGLAVNAGNHLTGRSATPRGKTYSFTTTGVAGTDIDLDCRSVQDGNNPPRPAWKCTVPTSGSTLYVFP